MNIAEEEVEHLTRVMQDAKAALESMKTQQAVLVRMLIDEKTAHEALKAWVKTWGGLA